MCVWEDNPRALSSGLSPVHKAIQYVYCTSMHLHREIVDVKDLNTVNSEIFARILFSRIAFKDIFAT